MTGQGVTPEFRDAALQLAARRVETTHITAKGRFVSPPMPRSDRVEILDLRLLANRSDALAAFDVRLHRAITLRGCEMMPDARVRYPGRFAMGRALKINGRLAREINSEALAAFLQTQEQTDEDR